jgi:hypothetical protein
LISGFIPGKAPAFTRTTRNFALINWDFTGIFSIVWVKQAVEDRQEAKE